MVRRFNYVNINDEFYDFSGKKVIIYGRAMRALSVYAKLRSDNIQVIGFTDSTANDGEIFANNKVISLKSIKDEEDVVLYVAVGNNNYKREILYTIENLELKKVIVVCSGVIYAAAPYDIEHQKMLLKESKEKIDYIKEKLADDCSVHVFENLLTYRILNNRSLLEEICLEEREQYFPRDGIIKPGKDEVFVDAGGASGSTTEAFIKWCNNIYDKSIIFEADDVMNSICQERIRIRELKNVIVEKKALWSKIDKLKFDSEKFLSGSAKVSETGSSIVDAVSLDEYLNGERVNYIKMDIEGSEMEALIGSNKTIELYRPKLAISIYHKESDLWEIPYYLMKKYPFYKFYMRHYTPYNTETILYATVRG